MFNGQSGSQFSIDYKMEKISKSINNNIVPFDKHYFKFNIQCTVYIVILV